MTLRFRATKFESNGHYGTKVVGNIDVPWAMEDLEVALPLLVVDNKTDSQLMSTGEFDTGFGRGRSGIKCLHSLMLDVDYCDPGDFEILTAAVESLGLAYLTYTTFSHRDPNKVHKDSGRQGPFDSFRLFLALSRPVSADEYVRLSHAVVGYEIPDNSAKYLREVENVWVPTKAGARHARPRGLDPVSCRPAQAYFMPSCPPERQEHAKFYAQGGLVLDVESALAREPATYRARTTREFQTPTQAGEGVLSDIVARLMDQGHFVQRANSLGWRRTACPSCAPGGVQKSPSCTMRANGDYLEVHCHAGCSRKDILAAVGLADDGALREPGALEDRLHEQLMYQRPKLTPVPVGEAVDALVVDIRNALSSGRPTIINYPAGTGKTRASAVVMTECARRGWRVVYCTQEHKVATETMSLLPPDVRARAVHLHSPLVQVAGQPRCRRADELQELVWGYGMSLRRKICPSCPFADTCDARMVADAKSKQLDDALVVFCSHAGIGQLFSEDEPVIGKLIVDEMPGVFEEVSVSKEMLDRLASREVVSECFTDVRMAVWEIARAWRAGEVPGEIEQYDEEPIPAIEVAARDGYLVLPDKRIPEVEDRALWKAADAVVRLAAFQAAGGRLFGLEDKGATGVRAMLPDACHRALVRANGVLLSATPLLAALPQFEHVERAVTDGAEVRRVMVLRGNRGSSALTKTFPDGRGGFVRREPEEGEGIPERTWILVSDALDRACAATYPHESQAVLFVSFSKLIAELRNRPDILKGRDIKLAHYGALRGKNDYMEGRPDEVSVVYLFGTPRMNVYGTLRSLGLDEQQADLAWRQYAASELTQCEGRLRLPRRTKSCTVIVEGDVAPATWTEDNVTEIDTGD